MVIGFVPFLDRVVELWDPFQMAFYFMAYQWGLLPSRELTYPTLGKGKSSSKVTFDGIC